MKRLNDYLSLAVIRDMRAIHLERQGGRCAICGRTASEIRPEKGNLNRQWQLDHCHERGVIRGVLCSFCNRGIGQFDDNPLRLLSAIFYLLLHKKDS